MTRSEGPDLGVQILGSDLGPVRIRTGGPDLGVQILGYARIRHVGRIWACCV